MAQRVARMVRELEPEDFHLLSGVEHGMRFSEWVDRSRLPEFARLTAEEVNYRLERCLKRKLVERKTIQYEGIRLRMSGYDALALHTFAERETITDFGAPLGVGKESDVFEVRSYRPMALKFHREGYANFRRVNREREYTADRDHVSALYTARKAAEREYDLLERLYPAVPVPRPEDHNRHAIVMEKIDGIELSRTGLPGDQVVPVLSAILEAIAETYDRGIVHADMSEYNVFVRSAGITIFDWPQAVERDHPNAEELLARDVKNIVGYFQQKYPNRIPDVDAADITTAIMAGTFDPAGLERAA